MGNVTGVDGRRVYVFVWVGWLFLGECLGGGGCGPASARRHVFFIF